MLPTHQVSVPPIAELRVTRRSWIALGRPRCSLRALPLPAPFDAEVDDATGALVLHSMEPANYVVRPAAVGAGAHGSGGERGDTHTFLSYILMC